MDVGEGAEEPAGEVDEVDEGDLEEGDAVGGLEVGDEDPDGGVWSIELATVNRWTILNSYVGQDDEANRSFLQP